jgi:esterase
MRLHFRDYGKGPPLIILHGLFGSLDNWTIISEQLSDRFHVYAVDQRNHGQSPHSDEMDYVLMAGDLQEFLADQSLPKVHLVGHSMGAKVAMQFCLLHPEKVERLVAVDMAPRAYPPAHEPIFKALLEMNLAQFHTRSQIEDALAPSIPDLAVRRFLLKSLGRDDGGHFHWKFHLRGLYRNYSRLCEALDVKGTFENPSLFIRGEKSKYIRAEDQEMIRRHFPRAEVRQISNAGHWVHVEATEIFCKTVRDFFAETFLFLPA